MKDLLLSFKKTDYAVILVFIVLSIILLLNHEPWRDEALPWLEARDASDIGAFFHVMGYGGTMMLWHLIVLPFAKSGLPYSSMAVLHFLLMLSAVIVFVKYAPFSKLQKILFVFGYYPLYEYNIIARNYVLFVLVVFLIAMLYKDRFSKPVFYSLLILILANTNVFGLVIAIIISGLYVFELSPQRNFSFKKNEIVSFSIIVIGFFAAIYQLWPPPDLSPRTAQWNFDLSIRHFARIPNAVFGAFLPIPQLKIDFWNSISVYNFMNYRPLWGLLLFILSLGFFIRKPIPMLIYLLSSVSFFSIFFLKYPGSLRHHGLIFIIFIFSLWIANEYEEKTLIKSDVINRLFNKNNLAFLFSALLFIHVIASSIAFYYELNYDFSSGKKTASFLKENDFINNDTFIASYKSSRVIGVLPYIPDARFYFIEYNDYHLIVGDKTFYLSANLSIEEIMDRVNYEILNKRYKRVLLILDKKTVETKVESKGREKLYEKYKLLVNYKNTIVDDESFYVYKLVK